MIASMGISVVAAGTITKTTGAIVIADYGMDAPSSPIDAGTGGDDFEDPYLIPREMGIFETIPSSNTESALSILHRIASRREEIQSRNEKSASKEDEYEKDKASTHEESVSDSPLKVPACYMMDDECCPAHSYQISDEQC